MEMSLTRGVWIHVDYSFDQAAQRGHSAMKSADPGTETLCAPYAVQTLGMWERGPQALRY